MFSVLRICLFGSNQPTSFFHSIIFGNPFLNQACLSKIILFSFLQVWLLLLYPDRSFIYISNQFKMDSSTTITMGIFILFFIILFVIINSNKKKKEAQFLLPLKKLAEKDNCEISHFDIWNNSVIGIDETQNIVFAIRKINDTEISQRINLAEVFRCNVAEVSSTSVTKEGNIKAFDRIDLAFSNKDKSKANFVVEFYNADTGRLTLTGELQLAEKWCKIANERIASISK